MKRVLYIGVVSEQGGAARSMLEMVKTINKNNDDIEPVVLCCHKKGHIDIYKKNGIEAYATNHAAFCFGREDKFFKFLIKYVPRFIVYKIKNIYALNYIRKNIDIENIDLIHSNSTRSDIGMILAKKYNITHVLHLREFGTKGTDYDVCYYRRRPLKFIDDSVDHYIAITNKVKSHWVQVNGYDPEKITVVYNGIDDSDIEPRKLEENKVDDNIRMVFTGFITESKGQKMLLDELILLDKSVLKRIQVDFIGSGDPTYVSELKKYAVDNGLDKHVNFLGRREDVHASLHKYDIGLVCSRAEAFGRVTAEYMLARLCVLASNTGANDEIIEDGISGILYDYNQKGSLAKKIEYLVNNVDVRKKIAENAYIRAKNNFVTQINADNVVKVYRKIWGDL